MGIRFYCPACDKKINVKEHQAGLRGICPKCGAGVDIPRVSEPKRPKQVGDARPSLIPIPGEVPGAAGEQTLSAVLPKVGRLLNVSLDPPLDPIEQAPQSQWYVVPPGATDPFGPADGKLLRQWMQEGRVGARSMVWRQDWADWRKAGTIWSELLLAESSAKPSPKLQRLASAPPQFGSPPVPGAAVPTSVQAALPPAATSYPGAAAPTAPAASAANRPPAAPSAAGFDKPGGELYYPRRTNGLYLLMVVLLVVAVIALGFVTLRILDQMRQKKPATPAGAEPAATSQYFEPDRYETGTTLRS
jgi:hypothetical protein